MIPFHRRFGKYAATFESTEARLIADLVDQVRHLLAERRAETPADPLAALTGMTVGPPTPPEDPAVARLLPDFHAEDHELSSGLRVLHEPEVIAMKDAAAVRLLDTLPRGGGTVRLDQESAEAWMRALNDVRLALGVRLEITEDDMERPPLDDDTDPSDDPIAAMFATYRWLSAVQDSLVTAMMD